MRKDQRRKGFEQHFGLKNGRLTPDLFFSVSITCPIEPYPIQKPQGDRVITVMNTALSPRVTPMGWVVGTSPIDYSRVLGLRKGASLGPF